MKKALLFITAIMLAVVLPTMSVSENIDLSVFSDEELQILLDRITQELLNRRGIEYWFDYGFGAEIPKIHLSDGREPELGITVINRNVEMSLSVENLSEEEYTSYVNDLIAYGFTDELHHEPDWFAARDENSHFVELKYYSGIAAMTIRAKKVFQK